MNSLKENLKEKSGKLLYALCSELCANALRPGLSLTERRYAYAKITSFRNSGSGPDAPSSISVIDL